MNSVIVVSSCFKIVLYLWKGWGLFRLITVKFIKPVQNGEHVCKLNGRHPNAVSAMAFNSFYDTLVTTCTHLCIWLPDPKFDHLE